MPRFPQELKELGGLQKIKAELPDWPVSDDTVLHLATAEGLSTGELGMTLNTFAASCTRFASNKPLIGLIRCAVLMRPHQDTHHTLPSSLLRSPRLKVNSNSQPRLDLLRYYGAAQVGGKR